MINGILGTQSLKLMIDPRFDGVVISRGFLTYAFLLSLYHANGGGIK